MLHTLNRLARLFNESVMGFFALVAFATALGPMVFDVSADVEHLLTAVEWLLVAAFAGEFCVQGALARDRRAWLHNPWRIVELVTILGPVLSLLPQISDVARGSLMLRMLRVIRAVAFGTRAGSVAVRTPSSHGMAVQPSEPTVSLIRAGGDLTPVGSDWSTFLAWPRQPAASWLHASNVSQTLFLDLARSADVSDQEISRLFDADGNAKLRESASHATLILQIPSVADDGFPEVHRDRLLAIVTKEGVLTATTGSVDLHDAVAVLAKRSALPAFSFSATIACALLSLARERNLTVSQRFDAEARRLEALEGGKLFLQDTFRLRREISTAALDLWHLKGIVRALADGKVTLRGQNLGEEKYLDELLAETDSLYETVNKGKEEIKTLIELHINFKSFEMNVFLKLLAVVSFMGLIPSVVGGLLGMNVAGNPWPVTLGQVAFGIAMGMATSLYVFAVKGWLK